jgi:hypothetical protein
MPERREVKRTLRRMKRPRDKFMGTLISPDGGRKKSGESFDRRSGQIVTIEGV